jgi:hypothetical protein
MRRRKRVELDTLTLVAGAAGAVWRCRFELALAAVIVSAQMLVAGLMGNFAAAVLLFAAASGMLAVPVARRWLLRALRAAHVRRRGGGRGRTASCRASALGA